MVIARSRTSGALSLGASFLVGAAVMNGEIAAGRLLAPYLGTSTTTWALLIGTVLGSLALGNLLGGALSARGEARGSAWKHRLLIASAIAFALLPRVVPWLLAGSALRYRSAGIGGLALVAGVSALLVALPMIALGAFPPLLLQAAGDEVLGDESRGLGQLSGRLSAAGTLGSLVGTFGSALVLLPTLGTRRTFDLGAALLLALALVLAKHTRDRASLVASILVSALLVGLGLLPAAWLEPPVPGLVWSRESLYNHVRIVDRHGERQLQVNDGFAVQSFARLDGQLPIRDVWAYYALAPSWGRTETPRRVLFLGLGGGTSARIYHELYPAAELVGVELDAAIVEAGRRFFDLEKSGVRVVIGDARSFVEGACTDASPGYDVVVLDAFQFPYVPFHLATKEHFETLKRCLAPGGVLVANVGRYDEARDVVHAVEKTLAAVFPYVRAADAGTRSNTIVVATSHPPADDRGVEGLVVSPASRQTLRSLSVRHAPLTNARWPEGTPLLTDDLAPVEHLTDRIVWRRR